MSNKMTTYECKTCYKNCSLILKKENACDLFHCVIGGQTCEWHKVTESEKPKKKKPEPPKGRPLPDWVEVGAYAYFDGEYHQITSISTNGQTPVVSFDTGEDLPWGGVRFDKVKEARLVPWTGDLSFCVGKAFKYKGVTMLCLASRGDCLSFVGGNEYKAKDLLEKGFTFADGSLCGEFEHLEYDPIDECFDWEN